MWAIVDLLFCVLPSGKFGCPGYPATMWATYVPCTGFCSCLHLSPQVCIYTLVLQLANITGQAFSNKRHTVPRTCYACDLSHADTNMPNAFTPPHFLTRPFQGTSIAWTRMLLQKTSKEVGGRGSIHCNIWLSLPLCSSVGSPSRWMGFVLSLTLLSVSG